MPRFSFQRVGAIRGLRGSPPPVAIDFGVASLKVLQIAPGSPPSLVAAAALETPDKLLLDPAKRLRFQLEALPELIRSGGFRAQRAVCSLPAGQMLCKHVQVLKADGVALSTLIESSLPVQIGCDASRLIFRHEEVQGVGRGGKAEVVCFAAGRDLVARQMQAIKCAKLEPVGIHTEHQAALTAFDTMGGAATLGDAPTLYIDMGRGSTKVTIAHGRTMVFARTIDFGGIAMDTALSQQLKVSMREANQTRLSLEHLRAADAGASAGEGPDGGGMAVLSAAMAKAGEESVVARGGGAVVAVGPRPDLSESLEILTDEVSMCLRYHRSLFPSRTVSRAVFLGGESRHRALCEHVARVLRLPAQQADPMAGLARTGSEPVTGVDFSESQPSWAVALGMCLRPTDL